MHVITTTDELAAFCTRARDFPFVTVDTEFLRERTYYAQLCLVQMAIPVEDPTEDDGSAVLIDTLADGLSLDPLYELFQAPEVVKVFHAARQDIEIFVVDRGVVPAPLFDTQVAAMVCGFGDQVGYETLVRKLLQGKIDKSSRFTDWSRRPLSDKQMRYALEDVTHLRGVYTALTSQIEATGRTNWVEQEMVVLNAPETYLIEPQDAWKRVKTRTTSRRFLGVVTELARMREQLAQDRNLPRARIFKDEALLEIAANRPKTVEELSKLRLLQREGRKHDISQAILGAVVAAEAIPADSLPQVILPPEKKPGSEGLMELLKVLLKARSDSANVAQRLIATSGDLDRLASEETPDIPALSGWRREVFGADALRLKRGEIALTASGDGVTILDISTLE